MSDVGRLCCRVCLARVRAGRDHPAGRIVEQVLGVNEEGGRPVACPTLFYLAHCEAGISENLLGANAEPARRAHLAVLGNSFAAYAERWAAAGSVQVRADGLAALPMAECAAACNPRSLGASDPDLR